MKLKFTIFGALLAIFTVFQFPPKAFGAQGATAKGITAKGITAQGTTDRYVLVSGFMNETMKGYFTDNILALNKLGVKDDHILKPNVPSKMDVEVNSEALNKQVMDFPGSEPLVIIAHSKGAVEVLIWAIQNSEFVRDHVRGMFLVQGAFGGSKIADFIEHKGYSIDKAMPLKYRLQLDVMRAEGWNEDRVAHDGLVSMTSEASAKLWPALVAQYPKAIANINKKVFYILGTEDVSKLPLLIRPMGSYLTTYYGKSGGNDGILLAKDQFVPGIGKILFSAEVGHMGWFMPEFESGVPSIEREYFTDIIYNYASDLEL
jgi:predicted alpha/beta hydrolase family esterase